MKLICPNCQKELTVPDHYAGQVMKCPLCNGTFTAPSLSPAAAATMMPAGGGATVQGVTPGSIEPGAPPPGIDVYPLSHEPAGAPPVPSAPPPPRKEPPSERITTAPAPDRSAAPPVPGEYQHRYSVRLSPKVMPWVAVAALVLIFFLWFFNWLGWYPGGNGVLTQNGWQAAFGGFSTNVVWEKMTKFDSKDEKETPGASGLVIVALLLFIPTLILGIASAALPLVQVPLPPIVQQLRPWRWLAVAGLTLAVLLFLGLQMLAGFSLENKTKEKIEKETESERKAAKTPEDFETVDLKAGTFLAVHGLHRTFWFKLLLVLHMLAVLAAAAAWWLEQRGARPEPRLDLQW
jgi:hypothetical protein